MHYTQIRIVMGCATKAKSGKTKKPLTNLFAGKNQERGLMSAIKFDCSSCRQSLEAPPEMGGQTVECPSCKSALRVPSCSPDLSPTTAELEQKENVKTTEERLELLERRIKEMEAQVSTKALCILDDQGNERIQLVMVADKQTLVMRDANGTVRAMMGGNKNGLSLGMMDEKGKARVMIRVDGNGPSLVMNDQKGNSRIMVNLHNNEPGLIIADENGTGRVLIGMDENEPRLFVTDNNQRPVWTAP